LGDESARCGREGRAEGCLEDVSFDDDDDTEYDEEEDDVDSDSDGALRRCAGLGGTTMAMEGGTWFSFPVEE